MLALEWIIDPPPVEGSRYLPNLLGWSFEDIYGEMTDPEEADDAVRGLAGLIVLGNGWENIDIFHALNVALQRDSLGFSRGREGGRNALAYFAWLRCLELVDAGRGSLLPDAPGGEALKSLLPPPDFVNADVLLVSAFRTLRDEADNWNESRTEFLLGRLNEGRHPDTDPDFWAGYTDRPAPALPTTSVPDAVHAWRRSRQRVAILVVFGIPVITLGLIFALRLRILAARAARAGSG